MDIKEAEILADSLMSQHLADRWKFKWDKATSRFGSCCNSSKTLTLSRKLTELNNIQDVMDTILHEIAHALDYEERGTSNHDKNWVKIAKSIGCDGIRCYGRHVITPPKPPNKWIASCSNCDYTTLKARYSVNACGKCCKKYNNGKYTKKFHLKYELIQNKLGITK